MRTKFLFGVGVVVLGALGIAPGCDQRGFLGRVFPGGVGGYAGVDGEGGCGGIGGAGGPGGGAFTLCPPAGIANTPGSTDAFRVAIARKWLSCVYNIMGGETSDALGTQGEGIEIKPDGRYWHLKRNSAGQLVGIQGVD